MVAFNFKKEFSPQIKSRKKRHTIRQKQRCKIGDEMQLYTGQRTKSCKLIKRSKCVDVYKIKMTKVGCFYKGDITLPEFAKRGGFKTPVEMREFFKNQYGLPFTGWVHVWR